MLVPNDERVHKPAPCEKAIVDFLVPARAASSQLTSNFLSVCLLVNFEQGPLVNALNRFLKSVKFELVLPLHILFDLVSRQIHPSELFQHPLWVRLRYLRRYPNVGLHLHDLTAHHFRYWFLFWLHIFDILSRFCFVGFTDVRLFASLFFSSMFNQSFRLSWFNILDWCMPLDFFYFVLLELEKCGTYQKNGYTEDTCTGAATCVRCAQRWIRLQWFQLVLWYADSVNFFEKLSLLSFFFLNRQLSKPLLLRQLFSSHILPNLLRHGFIFTYIT